MNMLQQPKLSRRSFVVSVAAAGGGMALGLHLPRSSAFAVETPAEVTAWVVIQPDDTILIRIAKPEMGQGSSTGLTMLVVEELEADWDKVRMEFVSAHENLQRHHVWGNMSAGGSQAIRTSQEYLRKAGAAARTMLIAAAAKRWNVPASELKAENNKVIHAATSRSLSYGELASDAARIAPPKDVPLKDPKEWKILGTPRKRLDTPVKITGEAKFGIDAQPPGLVMAAVAQCPIFGGKLQSADESKILSMRGVKQVVKMGDAVAVIADNWWRAQKALDAMPVVWDGGAHVHTSDASIGEYLRYGTEAGESETVRADGDAKAALAGAENVIERDYRVPFLNHATMEPQNCTVHITPDKVEVWVPSQNAEYTLAVAAEEAGVPYEQVTVHNMFLGGGFGRRGVEQDFTRLAVRVAKHVDGPVKVLWSREEDMQHDCFRPASRIKMRAAVDETGMPKALHIRAAIPSIWARYRPERLEGGRVETGAMEGWVEHMPYSIPDYLAEYARRNTAVPIGNWRSVSLTQHIFYRESFIDELAHNADKDPVEFRRTMLGKSPRDLGVLEAVVKKSGWFTPPPEGIYRGVAVSAGFGSYTAQIAEISIGEEGVLKVHRIVAAIDPGYAANPHTIDEQVHGGIVYGLTAALYGEIGIEGGRAVQTNFDNYEMLRIADMPKVEPIIMPTGGEEWGGVGEPSVPCVAPAICNAIFAATGRRIRSLPLKKHNLTRAQASL